MDTDKTRCVAPDQLWIKVVGMLQQNWAVINEAPHGATIGFFSDRGDVFDRLNCSAASDAEQNLKRNGFSLWIEDPQLAEFIKPPKQLAHSDHLHRPIYSSGEYWRAPRRAKVS